MKDYHARHEDIERALAELWPRIVQANVHVVDDFVNAKRGRVRLDGVVLTFIVEVECVDGKLWGHLSISAPKRLPTWTELRWCKEYFLGDRRAIQVLPPRAEYVNIHPHVLHLYAALEHEPLPDFRGQDSTGRIAI